MFQETEAPPNERHRKVKQKEHWFREGHEVSAGPVNLPALPAMSKKAPLACE